MARIALDAMGGDFAPRATVAGALLALGELDSSHSIQLVGQSEVVTRQLDALLAEDEFKPLADHRGRLEIVEAPEVIEMTDKPGAAVRSKPKSSMIVGLKLQAAGESDAFVSAGNTGAQMAASMVVLKLHTGLKRPAIATLFPTARKPVVVLDSGANVDCGADELVQFARLGACTPKICSDATTRPSGCSASAKSRRRETPSRRKHTSSSRRRGSTSSATSKAETCPPASATAGRSTSSSATGSWATCVLKFYEAIAPFIIGLLADVRDGSGEDDGSAQAARLLGAWRRAAPRRERRVSIISHGKSSPRAIKNAIKVGGAAPSRRRWTSTLAVG